MNKEITYQLEALKELKAQLECVVPEQHADIVTRVGVRIALIEEILAR